MLAVSSHDRNNHPERDYIASAIDLHTAFLNADIRQDVFEEAPKEIARSVVKISQSTETVAPACCDSLGLPELQPTPDRSQLLQKC